MGRDGALAPWLSRVLSTGGSWVRLPLSGVVLKNEVGERLEIEVEIVAKSAILQEFCIV